DLHVDGDRCWTELSLPDRFQGWDGIAHGGIICTILDEVMAWSLAATDNWGLTARMSVEFKRPVRLGIPVRGEGWISAVRRRIVETAGRIVDPATGQVLATATATYVAADAARKAELQARYRFRLAPSSTAADPARRPDGDPA
ncbi:MAG: PaaI family thioesterase, partial [Candidatus Limnocylindrales bacterium]